jgi:hypothetical protein
MIAVEARHKQVRMVKLFGLIDGYDRARSISYYSEAGAHRCRICVSAARKRREMTCPRTLKIFFWTYVAQALAGTLIGFSIPLIYHLGLL